MKGDSMMFSNTFNTIADKQASKYCSQLSKGDAFAVVHEITKVRTLKAPNKFDYIQKFIADMYTVQKLRAMIQAETDDSGLY